MTYRDKNGNISIMRTMTLQRGDLKMAKGGFPRGMGGGMNMNQMMKQAQKMQEQMVEMQEEMESKTYEAAAGGGAVKVILG